MRKIFAILILLLMTSFGGIIENSKNDWEKMNLKGKISKILEECYGGINKQGNIIIDSKRIVAHKTYSFDRMGFKTSEESKYNDEEFPVSLRTEYYGDNDHTTDIVYFSEGKMWYREEFNEDGTYYKYNESGSIEMSGKWEYLGKSSMLIKKNDGTPHDGIPYQLKNSYYRDGLLYENRLWGENSFGYYLTSQQQYKYDKNKQIVEKENISAGLGGGRSLCKYKYVKFDLWGNWTERIETYEYFDIETRYMIARRKIIYY